MHIYFHLIITNCWALVKTSPGAWLNVTFFSWWQTTFYWVTSKLVSTPLQNDEREKCIMLWFKELTYFYMHHKMKILLSAGNIFNPQLLFKMIWFTCKVSFQHNSNNFDTFTVICKSMVIITSMFFLNYIFNPFSSSVSFYSIEFMILWKL